MHEVLNQLGLSSEKRKKKKTKTKKGWRMRLRDFIVLGDGKRAQSENHRPRSAGQKRKGILNVYWRSRVELPSHSIRVCVADPFLHYE
jgi:hypothetical protein